jgi:hypothetical protein
VIKNKIMELTLEQMNDIDNILLTVDEDLSFEEKHEEVMDACLDDGVFDLEDDEDGDLYEEYSNLVWDYLEEKLEE